MKTLLLLRHAKSSWKDNSLDDRDRPLNDRGLRDAPRMGRLLKQLDLVPGQILSSPAARARSTAELVIQECGFKGQPDLRQDLYMGGPQAYIEAAQSADDAHERVLLVGHNPDIEVVLNLFTGEHHEMSTACLARINFNIASWSSLDRKTRGELSGLWRPKELPEE